MICFENYFYWMYENSGYVPIPPVTKFWKSGLLLKIKKWTVTKNCSRKQFPLQLALTNTVHISQDLTCVVKNKNLAFFC